MLQSLVQLLGADYEQWRSLTRVALKLDFRTASLGQMAHPSAAKGTARQLIAKLWIYVFAGAILSVLVARNKDVFFMGTILITYTMVMVSMLMLIDFGAVVISPDDFAILGYQPISSRTYFISRLTNVLVYAVLLSSALGFLPVIVFCFVLGFKPLLGLAALTAVLLGGITTTLFLVCIYAGILRVIHPNKLKRAMSYVQLVMSFILGFSYLILPRAIDAGGLESMNLEKHAWLFLIPSTWFASYLDLARGYWRMTEVVPALLSFAALGFLFVRTRGRLALDYADRLSSAMTVSYTGAKASRSTARRGWFFRRHESRAVSLLVRNQFKYDQKFRLAVLGILPLSAIYLFMGLRKGPLADPFVTHTAGAGDTWLVYFAALIFPTMLNAALANSDAWQASWIYYATPADRSRLVLASMEFVFAYFEIPYLVFLGALFFYFWGNVLHVVVHLVVLMLLSRLFLQFVVLCHPVLPFSMPSRKAQRSASMIIVMAFVPIASMLMLFVFPRFLYPNPPLLAAAIAGLIAFSWLLELGLKKRVQIRTASIEYQG
jgi:ABC-2 type transport system permease protein